MTGFNKSSTEASTQPCGKRCASYRGKELGCPTSRGSPLLRRRSITQREKFGQATGRKLLPTPRAPSTSGTGRKRKRRRNPLGKRRGRQPLGLMAQPKT